MSEVWLAVVGITGTATTAVLVNLLQNRAARDRASQDDRRRLTDLRRASIVEFAEAVAEYRRAQLHVWFEREAERESGRAVDEDHVPAAPELRAARTQAWARMYAVRLLWEDPAVVDRAKALLASTKALKNSEDREHLKADAEHVRAGLGELADQARARLIAV